MNDLNLALAVLLSIKGDIEKNLAIKAVCYGVSFGFSLIYIYGLWKGLTQ